MEDMMEDTAFKKAILRHLTTIESELMYITLNQNEELNKIASDLKENND